MNERKLDIVFLGLTITSTWGNGHATTYRGLVKELSRLGHRVTFLECDRPWYASNREFSELSGTSIHLYASVEELQSTYLSLIRDADVVVVGSYVPDGIEVGDWVLSNCRGIRGFYDIDTPVTLAALKARNCEYLLSRQIPLYDLYLSFTGGPTLDLLERSYNSPCARPLYCSVDPELYYYEKVSATWDIGYLGTYAADRQLELEELLCLTARNLPSKSFVVAGPQYPADLSWPQNVLRLEHLGAGEHRNFYNAQDFTLNLTRKDMMKAGYSPSVRLFEAAACGTAIITDCWPGLEKFFKPSREILPVRTSADVQATLRLSTGERESIGLAARKKVLKSHTAAVRARELVSHIIDATSIHARLERGNHVLLSSREASIVTR